MDDTLISCLQKTVKRLPRNKAIIYYRDDEWKHLTYSDFYEKINSLTNSLIPKGIKAESKIAIIAGNSPEWAIAYFSIICAGCVAVPLDMHDSDQNIKNILKEAEVNCVFISDEVVSKLNDCLQALNIKEIVVMEKISFDKGLSQSLTQTYSDDIASILYTSGTTASAKGVMLTHKNFIANFESLKSSGLFTQKDKVVCCLPLFHSYAFMINLILPLLTGACVIFSPSVKGEDLLMSVKDNGATVLVGVPELYYVIYSKIDKRLKSLNIFTFFLIGVVSEILYFIRKLTCLNFSKILFKTVHNAFGPNFRFFVSGGARLNPDVAMGLFKLGFTILEGYGLTETSPVATFNPIRKPKIGSVGKAVPGVEVRIDDPLPGKTGEILIKGDNVMRGYYKKPEQTNEVIRDDWFYSGDLGYIDEQGYVFITGRKKELIVLSSGKNIYPQDMEAYYRGSEFIKELCVFDPAKFYKQQVGIFALVIPDIDAFKRCGETDIDRVVRGKIDNLSEKMPPHTRITDFRIDLEELPKTRLGKIKRYKAQEVFKKLYEKQAQRPVALTEDEKLFMQQPTAKTIIDFMKQERKFKGGLVPSDSLELGLGLDSLGRIELLSMLEEGFAVDIPEKTAAGWFTFKDVVCGVNNILSTSGIKATEKAKIAPDKLWSDLLKKPPPLKLIKKIKFSPSPALKVISFLFLKLLYSYFKIFMGLKIYGKENIPEQGPYIICTNHTSYFDAFLVACSVAFKHEMNMYFMAYRGYFELPLIRNTVRAARVIPVDTARDLIPAMQTASYVLKRNKALCIFPEGERSIDGKLKKFKNGVGILSKELSVPIIPCIIKGAYQAWPRTKAFPGIHKIEVCFGPMLNPEILKDTGYGFNAKDDYQAISSGLRQKMSEMA